MKVVDLLSSFRGIGPTRAADIMEDIGIAANRRVGGLGSRQVEATTDVLAQRFPRGGA
jgi:ribosomal protein S13